MINEDETVALLLNKSIEADMEVYHDRSIDFAPWLKRKSQCKSRKYNQDYQNNYEVRNNWNHSLEIPPITNNISPAINSHYKKYFKGARYNPNNITQTNNKIKLKKLNLNWQSKKKVLYNPYNPDQVSVELVKRNNQCVSKSLNWKKKQKQLPQLPNTQNNIKKVNVVTFSSHNQPSNQSQSYYKRITHEQNEQTLEKTYSDGYQ